MASRALSDGQSLLCVAVPRLPRGPPAAASPYPSRSPTASPLFFLCRDVEWQGFGHAVFCARDALLGTGDSTDPPTVREKGHPSSLDTAATTVGDGTKRAEGGNAGGKGPKNGGSGGESEEVEEVEGEDSSFMLVLGDHLYRRGAGTTHACASQLIHAFLEHGEAGKPAIGLKVRVGRGD